MRITQEADYALRISFMLAQRGGVVDAGGIAKGVGVTDSFTLKILRKLSGKGLVRSKKGINGGYELALSPGEISMRRVIEAIDGPVEISRCLSCDYNCTRMGDCKDDCTFHLIFKELNHMLASKLDEVTLSSVLTEDFDINEFLKNY